jgi:hypothetical protein
MTGENFRRFHQGKSNELRQNLERLERQRSVIWDEFEKWCYDNPSGGTPPKDYEQLLKDLSFKIENVKYLMRYR